MLVHYVQHKPERIGNKLLLSEHDLHCQVADFLNIALPPQAFWHHSPMEGKHKVQYRVKQNRLGAKKRFPDILIIWKGRAIFIELKTKKGRVSDAQKECHAQLILAGGLVTVCRSLKEVEEFCKMALV